VGSRKINFLVLRVFNMRFFIKLLKVNVLFGFIVCLGACSTLSSGAKDPVASKVMFHQMVSMEVQEAYFGENNFYLKIKVLIKDSQEAKIFYGRGIFDFSYPKKEENIFESEIPVDFIDQEEWTQRDNSLDEVGILPVYHWQEIQDVLSFLQKENEGVLIENEGGDLVFYYDQEARLRVVDAQLKPKDLVIIKRYDQKALSKVIFSSLEKYLRSVQIFDKKIIFTTNRKNDFYNSFFFVDLDKKRIVNLKILNLNENKYKKNIFKNGIKNADHMIIDSHVFGIATRPISSLLRLFYWSRNTTYDLISHPPLPSLSLRGQGDIPSVDQKNDLMDMEAFDRHLNKITGSNVSSGNMNFLVGGDEFFPKLIERLQNAKKSIKIRIFIFDNDDYAVKIANILKAKSKEPGMEVKVLLDGMGQIMGEGTVSDSLPAGFRPPDSIEKYLKKDSKVQVRVTPNSLLRADHTKTITIDNKVCFTGGMNIGREYRYHWHDLMMELKGGILEDINKDFDLAWANAGFFGDFDYFLKKQQYPKEKKKGQGYAIRLLFTQLNNPQIYKAQVHAIRKARKYIYIHNAYFSDNTILNELIKARKRGVDVRVILPVANNHAIMNANNIVTANIMFKNGIQVYFYPGMSHVKAAIYDGWLCAGSANFDRLSFLENKEFDLATSHKETVDDLRERLFEKDFKRSKKMTALLKSGWKEYIAELLAEQL